MADWQGSGFVGLIKSKVLLMLFLTECDFELQRTVRMMEADDE